MPSLNKKGNTRVVVDEGTTMVIFHQTAIVKFNEKKIILDSGGWFTSTTKSRMNQAAEEFDLGFTVYQKSFIWYAKYKDEVIPFDGNTLELKR